MAERALACRRKFLVWLSPPTCDLCGAELKKFGAILLSPPKGRAAQKLHACVDCWEKKVKPMVKPEKRASKGALRKPRR